MTKDDFVSLDDAVTAIADCVQIPKRLEANNEAAEAAKCSKAAATLERLLRKAEKPKWLELVPEGGPSLMPIPLSTTEAATDGGAILKHMAGWADRYNKESLDHQKDCVLLLRALPEKLLLQASTKDFNAEAKTLTLREAETDAEKPRTYVIPLPDEAQSILQQLVEQARMSKTQWLFPSGRKVLEFQTAVVENQAVLVQSNSEKYDYGRGHLARAHQIGFDPTELAQLLDENGIAYGPLTEEFPRPGTAADFTDTDRPSAPTQKARATEKQTAVLKALNALEYDLRQLPVTAPGSPGVRAEVWKWLTENRETDPFGGKKNTFHNTWTAMRSSSLLADRKD